MENEGVAVIEPTIGRIVLFNGEVDGADHRVRAAMIVSVVDRKTVHLHVFNHDGTTEAQLWVYLHQEDSPHRPTHPYAEWMPYQKGQAAKTEALEAQLKA